MNNSGSQTALLVRPMWTSVDGNYTPWIAYLGNSRRCVTTHFEKLFQLDVMSRSLVEVMKTLKYDN